MTRALMRTGRGAPPPAMSRRTVRSEVDQRRARARASRSSDSGSVGCAASAVRSEDMARPSADRPGRNARGGPRPPLGAACGSSGTTDEASNVNNGRKSTPGHVLADAMMRGAGRALRLRLTGGPARPAASAPAGRCHWGDPTPSPKSLGSPVSTGGGPQGKPGQLTRKSRPEFELRTALRFPRPRWRVGQTET